MPVPEGFRDGLLRAIVWLGVVFLTITEMLSVFQALHRIPLLIFWAAVACFAAARWRVPMRLPAAARDPVVALAVLCTAAILVVTAVTAAFSAPNSYDVLAYHMPRVVYWAQQGSVRFFQTSYLNQIMLQPLAEYFMLHSYVVTGGDRLVNFVQWFGSLGSVIAVSAIAGLWGASARGQAIAALFCATLPSGILASSGANNDYFLAMWLVAAVYFAARFARSRTWADAAMGGMALGLAMLTKATAYLFAPWLLAAVLLPGILRLRPYWSRAVAAVGLAVILNVPHYVRNFELSGSVLGFDSADGNGLFRWRNEPLGWKPAISNLLRNVSDQTGGRSEKWNRRVYDWTVRAHQWMGIEVNDPGSTWRYSEFAAPRNTNHETDANNKWHLLLLGIAAAMLLAGARKFPVGVLYAIGLVCGFLAFCVYLKWQPYGARLFLPLFVAGSPLIGTAVDLGSKAKIPLQIALCLFLVSVARLPALQNWLRPLAGPNSVLKVPREEQYFSDIRQLVSPAEYARSAALAAGANCSLVGIDSNDFALEYPLMVLLKQVRSDVRFVHSGVANASSRFRSPMQETPCAVVCLKCAEDAARLKLYDPYPVRIGVDQFVVFHR
jgi:hypothetical protein